MRDLLLGLSFVVMILSPCLVALVPAQNKSRERDQD